MSARGLICDYGGVMTTPIFASFNAFCDTEGITRDEFRNVMTGAARTEGSPFAMVETGEITEEQFDEAVAKLLSDACGKTIASSGLKQRMFALVKPDEAMWAAVRAARAAGIHTGLLSNSWGGRDYPIDDLKEIFDDVVISGHVGLRKPDPEIYLLSADRIGALSDDCVFVDDFSVNVEGAEAVGMTGVLHKDARTTIARLEELLELDLGPAADARTPQR
ncbi:MAG TPA: HAD family phosphatase [Actinomycetota bacterium]|nr:HAD family phosphatase [Actinomycetota bacterium]